MYNICDFVNIFNCLTIPEELRLWFICFGVQKRWSCFQKPFEKWAHAGNLRPLLKVFVNCVSVTRNLRGSDTILPSHCRRSER